MIDANPSLPGDPALHEFLRLCLNSKRHPPDLEATRSKSESLDWMAAVAYASSRYVAPTLYSSLKGSGILPSDIEADLHSAYLESAQRNLRQAEALKKLLEAFTRQGIESLLLKGLALAVPVYGDVAARPSRDIDLLLRPGDIQKALPLTEALGYLRHDLPEHAQTDLEFENEIILFRAKDGMNVDLHWSPFDSPFYQQRLDMEWFWSQTVEFRLSGTGVRSLTPESNLIYLCGHLVLHHRGDELLWSNDIAELLFRFQDRLDWGLVLEKAKEFRLVLPLREVLNRLASGWQAIVPGEVLHALHHTPISEEEQRVLDSLSGERLPSGRHFLSDFQNIPGWRKRTRYALQLIFPSLEYMRHRYKIKVPWSLPLYYPYRWWLGIVSLFKRRR